MTELGRVRVRGSGCEMRVWIARMSDLIDALRDPR
jgi:hypothetical protein